MAALVQATLQGSDQRIALGFDPILHVEDFAPLATLLAFQSPDSVLDGGQIFHRGRSPGAPLGVLQAGFGVLQGLLGPQQLVFDPLAQPLALGLEVGVVLLQRLGERRVDLPPDIDLADSTRRIQLRIATRCLRASAKTS